MRLRRSWKIILMRSAAIARKIPGMHQRSRRPKIMETPGEQANCFLLRKAENIISALRAGNKLVPVELLGLSNRAYNCIKRLKKNDIADLLEMYPDGYFQIKNAGRKTVDELQGAVEAYVRQYLPLGFRHRLSGGGRVRFADAEPTAGEAQAEPSLSP